MSVHRNDIDESWVKDVAIGGATLGGGGGGDIEEGIELGRLAVEYGTPSVVPIDELDDDELVVTVSAVGAPAAEDRHVEPADYVRAFELVREELVDRGGSVGALMTNEMGGTAAVNGMLQSAVTDVPVVDAACNGRAHPTGPMGSIGLDTSEPRVQAAAGGDSSVDRHVELLVEAPLERAASMVRGSAETAGGLVAVARNPASAAYVREHAAVDVYEDARAVGRAIREHDGERAVEAVADSLGGEVLAAGEVDDVSLRTEGGFDVGEVRVDELELTFWNEYMTAERDGQRLGTFPDLITTLSVDDGYPVTTAEIAQGQRVAVVHAPAENLTLGAGMRRQELFEPIEEAIDRPVIANAFDEPVSD